MLILFIVVQGLAVLALILVPRTNMSTLAYCNTAQDCARVAYAYGCSCNNGGKGIVTNKTFAAIYQLAKALFVMAPLFPETRDSGCFGVISTSPDCQGTLICERNYCTAGNQ